MKDNFLQSLNSYTDALEQKMDSLEKRVNDLEQQLHNALQENETIKAKLGRMEEFQMAANQQLASLQLDTPVPQRPASISEPEIELEPEPIVEPEPIEEPIVAAPIPEPEPIEEPVAAPVEEEPISQALSLDELPTIDTLDNAEPIPMDNDAVVALDDNAMPDLVPIQPIEDMPVVEEPAIAEPQPIAEPVVAEPVAARPIPERAVRDAEPAPAPVSRPNLYGPTVTDIRQAISLGDRFLFQRELFGQSGEKLQKTLDAINQFSSFDEALNYLDTNFNWDKESTAYNLFINVLHRRFA